MADLQLFQYVWPLSPPKRTRTKPMRVLALGLPRTGTDSLRAALSLLGYAHVYHGFDRVDDPSECVAWLRLWHRKLNGETLTAEDFDTVLGHCEAITDFPACMFAADLIKAYPEARIIINHRPDINAWHKSVIDTWSNAEAQCGRCYRILTVFHPRMFWLRRLEVRITQLVLFRGSYRANAKEAYRDHYAMLDGVAPKERTLTWTVQDGWVPLCEFLNKPVPESDFPNRNALDAVLKRVVTGAMKDGQQAFVNMMLVMAAVLGLMLAAAWSLARGK